MPNTIVVNYKCASKARTLFGRIGLWLADGQVPGSVDLVRLARSRSQPARSPRRCRPDGSAARPAGAPDRPGPGPGPRPGRADARALGTTAVARWPLHNAVRVDEACAAGIAGLGQNCGHRVIGVVRNGRPEGEDPAHRGHRGGLWRRTWLTGLTAPGRPGWRQLTGSLLATAGGRLRQGRCWELVRCLSRPAGIGAWEQLWPRCLPARDHFRPGRRGLPARRPGLRQRKDPRRHPPE